jgi:WD40 repeat protein
MSSPPLLPLEGHTAAVHTLSLHPPYLLSGSADTTLRLWDITTTPHLLRGPLRGHESSITALHFNPHPEQDIIISGDATGNIITWRFSTGALLQKIEAAHGSAIMSLDFDGDGLATGGGMERLDSGVGFQRPQSRSWGRGRRRTVSPQRQLRLQGMLLL